MIRRQVEHVVRAAAAITDLPEFVVVGSQAALVQHRDLPPEMLRSPELDIYPLAAPDLADLIDGAIGEGSPFHRQFGYYGHGVGPETAKLPAGWESRACRLRNDGTRGATAIAPELHDLCAAKLAAGREKDFEYVAAALGSGLVRREELTKRVGMLAGVDPAVRERAVRWVRDARPPAGPKPPPAT